MKSQGRIREIVNTITGLKEWSRYPASREEALAEDVSKYFPAEVCPVHGGRTVYFVHTGIAGCCAHHDAAAAYNEAAIGNGEPCSIADARTRGLNYLWTPQANPYCGHPGKITFGGKCAFCADERAASPRQTAIRSGATWYQPAENDPCGNGHTAERRVSNGSCRQCEADSKARARGMAPASTDTPIYKLVPDLVIDREAAEALGFKVFRTGKPCRRGHAGWRYISTGGCLDCK